MSLIERELQLAPAHDIGHLRLDRGELLVELGHDEGAEADLRDDDVSADVGQRALDGSEIPGAHVDDRDHVLSVPLVDGTAPPRRGSIFVAMSQARANAL